MDARPHPWSKPIVLLNQRAATQLRRSRHRDREGRHYLNLRRSWESWEVCGDLHVLLLRKGRCVMRYPWGQLLQPSHLSGIQQSSGKPRSYCVCFPSAPVAPEPNVSGPAWLTLCSHIFLSAVFTSFTWKALTNYKNWKKKKGVHSEGCVLRDQSRVSHSRFGCDVTQVHTENDEPPTANKWQSRRDLWLWGHLTSTWHSYCRHPQRHPPFS